MKYKTLNEYKEEKHPWPPYIPEGADKLILGTFPTAEVNRKTDFYYPNPSNRFWTMLSEVNDSELESFDGDAAIKERKQILDDLKLGIGDMGYRIYRQGKGSSDGQLFPIEYTDIFKLLDENESIKTLILTSKSGPNSVFAWFKKYCQLNEIKLVKPKGKYPLTKEITVGTKTINIIIIPSTSRISRKTDQELIDLYEEAINDY